MNTVMIQAPAGGHVSPVNGQFYEGGQFMPDHGLFCGMSVKNQLKTINDLLSARFDETARYEKIVREGSAFRYLYRTNCFGAWTQGCVSETLTEMATVLKVEVS